MDKIYIKYDDKYATYKISKYLSELIDSKKSQYKDIIIMCIGTDRSTGDSLGPYVGYNLDKLKHERIHIYGTLENPLHAQNLKDILHIINIEYPESLIIAVDSCLSPEENNIGSIVVYEGSLKPGAGLQKELPEVGNISIKGIVNKGGFMDFLVLQSTRLNLVVKMSDIIARSIENSLIQIA
jgi:putative sporulation protein YyaC